MIEYRTFRNSDPPHIVRLWHECRLGRGAAQGISCDEFDEVVFAQSHFDPAGLIVACDAGLPVGFIHAGFGVNESLSWLSPMEGVIAAVMVHPQYRKRGIGRTLVEMAVKYLQQAGSQRIFAGLSEPRDSFYSGLYGGSQSAGFLESDVNADPFFRRLGYQPHERHLVFQRRLDSGHPDPVSIRLVGVRQKTRLAVIGTEPRSWWWQTRHGRLDAMHLALVPKTAGTPLARVSVVGMDRYLKSWNERAIGILGLYVGEAQRRQGYGQALLCEVCRRVKDDLIDVAEAHALEEDTASIGVLKSSGFEQIDVGVVYRLG